MWSCLPLTCSSPHGVSSVSLYVGSEVFGQIHLCLKPDCCNFLASTPSSYNIFTQYAPTPHLSNAMSKDGFTLSYLTESLLNLLGCFNIMSSQVLTFIIFQTWSISSYIRSAHFYKWGSAHQMFTDKIKMMSSDHFILFCWFEMN